MSDALDKLDETHDPALESLVESANDPACEFPIQNLPYCVFRAAGESRFRVGVGIGDRIESGGVVGTIVVAGFGAMVRHEADEVAGRYGATVVIESIFDWQGIGQTTLNAVQDRDYPLIQGAVIVVAACFIVVNFIVDMLYLVIDPRIRYRAPGGAK